MKNVFVIAIIAFWSSTIIGQELKTVYYHLDKVTVKNKETKDSVEILQNLENALIAFQLNGYAGVFATDTILKKNAIHYYFGCEHAFKKVVLIPDGQKKKYISSQKNLYRTAAELNAQLTNLENNGYPFAQLRITQQIESDELLQLTYEIDSGSFYTIDKIHLKSQSEFHAKTVLNIIGIKAGDPYNESKIRAISEILLSSLIYYSPRAPELIFRVDKAELFVYFEKKKSSNADGFVGFQQDRFTNQLTLNGYLNLELKNALNRAETIHLNWKNNPDKTQNLHTIVEYPYLFSSPFGIGTEIDLQKQDTSFVRSDLLFELTYRNPQFRISIFDQIEASNTLTSIPIPGFRDFSKNTIGATVQFRPFLNDQFNFYHPKFTVSGGIFNYKSDTLDDNTRKIANHKYRFKYEHKIDFLRFFHLNNSIQFQGLASSVGLARNEYIYFGGLQTVRGFYELELAGRENWILRNEIEFQPVSLLSLKLIYDYSNFRNETHNYTHSVGFGFALINKDSQLEIIVANGKLNNNPFNASGTKVHIGFRSNF